MTEKTIWKKIKEIRRKKQGKIDFRKSEKLENL